MSWWWGNTYTVSHVAGICLRIMIKVSIEDMDLRRHFFLVKGLREEKEKIEISGVTFIGFVMGSREFSSLGPAGA